MLSYQQMWSALNRIVEQAQEAGIELPSKLAWHSLRKSFATNYRERNPEDIWVLMDMMGHISPSTLNRYVNHSRKYYDEAIDNMVLDLTSKSIQEL